MSDSPMPSPEQRDGVIQASSVSMIVRDPQPRSTSLTLRDLVGVGFRHRRLFAITFLAVLTGAIVGAFVLPKYSAEMQVIVQRERMDPIITPEQNASASVRGNVTEEEINSEAQLLKSADLLWETVIATGLDNHGGLFAWARSNDPAEKTKRIAHAARNLDNDLIVEPVRKSNTIRVQYSSRDPREAAAVVEKVGELYLKKHTAVHANPGEVDFFERQQQQYQRQLAQSEAGAAQFAKETGVLSASQEQSLAVERSAALKSQLQETEASIQAADARLAALLKMQDSTPKRQITAVRIADNPQIVQMKATLMGLELKRTELLTKYQPTYRGIRDLDEQIAEARSAIQVVEKAPLRDETTDQDRSYEWIRGELAKVRAERSSLNGQAAALKQSIAMFSTRAAELAQLGVRQAELIRAAKSDEESYLLYKRKAEEAKISAALDKDRIVNVAIAEPPLVPVLPTHSRPFYLALGLVAAFAFTSMVVFTVDYLEPRFHTPRDLQLALQIPVLAALPRAALPAPPGQASGSGNDRSTLGITGT